MSFNRLTYDTCAYSKTLQESTDPLGYNLYKGKYEYCISCPVGNFTNNLELILELKAILIFRSGEDSKDTRNTSTG